MAMHSDASIVRIAYVFELIDQVREVPENWLREYNEERPHDGLGRVQSPKTADFR
jgi:Integrase core domain